MLKDKYIELIETLGLTTSALARYSCMDIPTLSRIKNGLREPKAYSAPIEKLLDGVLRYTNEQNEYDKLDALIDYRQDGSRREALRRWFFPVEESDSEDFADYPDKLSAIMKLAGLSNQHLSSLTGISTSYICRIRKGERQPGGNPEVYEPINHALFDEIKAKELADELKSLIGSEADTNSIDFFFDFAAWLCNFSSKNPHINALLSTLDSVSDESIPNIPMLPEEELQFEDKQYYYNDAGLQEAVLRFLWEAINSKQKVVYLYSDKEMRWMIKNKKYLAKWAAMMNCLVSNGVRVKIIHNIDRRVPDLVNAVQNWLPLYLSCNIEPYYMNNKNGSRFTHTLFICPDVACISAFNAAGAQQSRFTYSKSKDEIEYCCSMFNRLLKKSQPLMTVNRNEQIETAESFTLDNSEFHNIEIKATTVSVTVTRIIEPKISFVILNQQLRSAIQAYAQSKKLTFTPPPDLL